MTVGPTRVRRLAAAVTEFERAVGTPTVRWEGHDLTVGVSVGVATFPHDGHEAGSPLQAADASMYAVKQRRRVRAGA